MQDNIRYFMAPNDGGFKQVGLSPKGVETCTKFNRLKPDKKFDSIFLKALLIGFCSIDKIKQSANIDEGIKSVVQQLFEWRAEQDADRKNEFEQLFTTAIDGIKKSNLNV